MKKTHVSRTLALFCGAGVGGVGRCESLDSFATFLWCAPQLSGLSPWCFLILSPLRVHTVGAAAVAAGTATGNPFVCILPFLTTKAAAAARWL